MYTATILALTMIATLEVGDRAPNFSARDTEGKALELSTLLKTGPVVLTFYPKAFTSGCTKQMKSFGELQETFADLKAQVVAISADDVETQNEFREAMGAAFPFVADPDGKIIELYDIKTPLFTFAKRRTFVIGTDGTIKSIEEGDDVIDVSSTADLVRTTCGG